ncbi:MAG TPA: hypothetical protein VIM69_11155, partial [Opitutaceae bacterium]
MKFFVVSLIGLAAVGSAYAGAPYLTDDPEPVEFHHVEIYVSSLLFHDEDGTAGNFGAVEVNYGPAKNLQLHIIAPMALSAPRGAARSVGYGDTELGVKYRFVDETDDHPQAAIYPTIELPTGNTDRGLGNGKTEFFLPLWLQKSFGTWTTYGGGGYWFHPGEGNRDFWVAGILLQKQVTKTLSIGAEVFHEAAQTDGGRSDTRINLGTVWDLSDRYHVLASAGPIVQG